MTMTEVSIVTIVKNNSAGLKETYQSLYVQKFPGWEMIIVVGHSSDDSLQFAHECQLSDSRVRVLEQEDIGIYNAMNIGLAASTGQFVWFMNSGDRFANPEVLGDAVDQIRDSHFELVIGGYCVSQVRKSNFKVTERETSGVSRLSFAFNRRGGCHQAMIFRRDTINMLGGFDTRYSLASDFDLVMRVLEVGRAKKVSKMFAVIEPGGLADRGIFLVHQQKHEIRRIHLRGPFMNLASVTWTLLARVKITTRHTLSGL
jgi:glycosyltransferase involved in cell wall biosynthesis